MGAGFIMGWFVTRWILLVSNAFAWWIVVNICISRLSWYFVASQFSRQWNILSSWCSFTCLWYLFLIDPDCATSKCVIWWQNIKHFRRWIIIVYIQLMTLLSLPTFQWQVSLFWLGQCRSGLDFHPYQCPQVHQKIVHSLYFQGRCQFKHNTQLKLHQVEIILFWTCWVSWDCKHETGLYLWRDRCLHQNSNPFLEHTFELILHHGQKRSILNNLSLPSSPALSTIWKFDNINKDLSFAIVWLKYGVDIVSFVDQWSCRDGFPSVWINTLISLRFTSVHLFIWLWGFRHLEFVI